MNDRAPITTPIPAAAGPALWIYRGLLGFDGLAAAVIVYFFMLGLADGSVSSFNAGLWATILASLLVIIGGGIALHRARKTILGILLLMVLAIPGLLYVLFVLMLLVVNPRWN